jgi:uncharacterized delta-60 repeat protein
MLKTDETAFNSTFWSKVLPRLKISGLGLLLGLLVIALHLPAPTAGAGALTAKNLSVAATVRTANGGQLDFSTGIYTGTEGSSTVVTVTRSGTSAGAVAAHIPITDVTTTAGTDYLRLGDLDTTFTTTANTQVAEVTVQTSDNKILISGSFTTVNGINQPYLARLNPDGSFDSGFSPVVNERVFGVAVQNDGKIVIGGLFTTVNGITRTRVARLNPDGSLDNSFNASANNEVYAAGIQSDGKIVIGGLFTQTNSISRSNIARLNLDGSLDTAFTPVITNSVYAVRVQADDKIAIGGPFLAVNGTGRTRVARLNADGSLDTSFIAAANNTVFTLGIQNDGKIIIGGTFSTVNAVSRSSIARLNPDGTNDNSFQPVINFSVVGLDLQNDGRIVIGGSFTNINGTPRSRIARLIGDYTVSWADGETGSKTVSIPIRNDGAAEPDETATFSLQIVQGLATIGTPPTATLFIPGQTYSTTTSVTSQPNPSLPGQSVTFTTTVNNASSNLPVPSSGVVTLTLNSSFWVSGTLDVNGQFTIVTNTLPSGNSGIVANYGGVTDNGRLFNPSQSAPYQHIVDNTSCFTVTSSLDNGIGLFCGTLSYALSAAINRTAPITITFAPTLTQIVLTGALPSVPNGVIIDGGCSVQNGRGVPGVRLTAGDGASANALILNGNATIRGLAITGFGGWAVDVITGSNRLSCNYIGTTDGVTATGNGGGIRFGANAGNNTLGEEGQPASGNLISGNNGVGLEVSAGSLNNTLYYNLFGYLNNGISELDNTGGSLKLLPGGQLNFRPNNKIR